MIARASALALAAALAALTLASGSAAQTAGAPETTRLGAKALERLIDRIASESDAVIAAARGGGVAAIRRALDECWSAGAGYGVEALGPCVTRERAALALTVRLEAKVGPLGDPALTEAASARRIAGAYSGREARPTRSAFSAEPLLVYAVGRRAEARWSRAPSLHDIAEAAASAFRRRGRGEEADLAQEAATCWIRLALSRDRDVEQAWRCRIESWAAGERDDQAQGRDALFFHLTRADEETAQRAAAALSWMQAALEGDAR